MRLSESKRFDVVEIENELALVIHRGEKFTNVAFFDGSSGEVLELKTYDTLDPEVKYVGVGNFVQHIAFKTQEVERNAD